MKLLHLTLDSPEANLALDEALLDATDAGGDAILRLWESPQEFVVVGYGNDPALEANLQECRRQGVPVLRRCSGGGTVVQGPGCLNYSVTLPISAAAALETIHGANQFVMEKLRAALRPWPPTPGCRQFRDVGAAAPPSSRAVSPSASGH